MSINEEGFAFEKGGSPSPLEEPAAELVPRLEPSPLAFDDEPSDPVDVLAIGAHPDDVEVGIGGLIHKLTTSGHKVGILDLTRGEMGSRGNAAERKQEAAEAARRLGVTRRKNAGLTDGAVSNTAEQQRILIPYIRSFRPKLLLAPMQHDRHPDHHAAHALVRDANYFSGLYRIDTEQEPYRIPIVYHYRVYAERGTPDFIVDISGHFQAKIHALKAYASQFHNPNYEGPPTYVASEDFWDAVQVKAAYLGSRIGAKHGEALYSDGTLGVDLPPGLE